MTLGQIKSIHCRPSISTWIHRWIHPFQIHPVRWLGTNRCTFIPPLAKTSVNNALTMQIGMSLSGKMTTKVSCPDHRIKKHMLYSWIQSQIRLPIYPVPVAVISKNLDIDSASCSDCNKLYHLGLRCASCKNSFQQTGNPDRHASEDILIDLCSRRCNIHATTSACTWLHQVRAFCQSPHSSHSSTPGDTLS